MSYGMCGIGFYLGSRPRAKMATGHFGITLMITINHHHYFTVVGVGVSSDSRPGRSPISSMALLAISGCRVLPGSIFPHTHTHRVAPNQTMSVSGQERGITKGANRTLKVIADLYRFG